ncbi:MAG: dihydroneopterin aldolase [Magnetovibrionaceae bacterium]
MDEAQKSDEVLPAPRALDIASARNRIRHVFVRDLVLDASIGVHAHEKDGNQRVRFNVDLAVAEDTGLLNDDLRNVVDYEVIVDGIRAILGRGHINLVETLAEEVAEMCLGDERVGSVRVRVEKLDIFENAESVGVEIERHRKNV